MRAPLILICLLLWPLSSMAVPVGAPLVFDNHEQERQYQHLLRELRCTVCQNQSLVDSNAALAADLRAQVYEMTRAGKSEQAIIDFMVQRYGDFVLYRPPLRAETWLLWFAPFLLLLAGLGVWWGVLRSRRGVERGSDDYDIRED